MIPLLEPSQLEKLQKRVAQMNSLNEGISEFIAQAQTALDNQDADALHLAITHAKNNCRVFWRLVRESLNQVSPPPARRYKKIRRNK